MRLVALAACAVLLAGCSGHGRGPLDPSRLPKLPPQILVVQRGPDAVLVRLDGSEIGRLAGFHTMEGNVFDRGDRVFRLRGGRLRAVPTGAVGYREVFTGEMTKVDGRKLDCEEKLATRGRDAIVACIGGPRRAWPGTLGVRAPDGRVRTLVPAPHGVGEGSWFRALVSPDRKQLLLEWSGGCQTRSGECRTTSTECGVSTVFLAPAAGGEARRVLRDPSADAYAVGWTDDGRPLVDLPQDVCGQRGGKPGVYAVGAGMRLKMIVAGGSHATLLRP